MKARFLLRLAALASSSLIASACVGPQAGLNSTRSQFLGTYNYTSERRINGVVHYFEGSEVKPVVRLPASESVVNWVDTSTGARYQTTVQCLSGWLSWAISGEDCIDSIDLYDHVRQLPGD